MHCLAWLVGDERAAPTADGDEGLLQLGEARRLQQHRRRPLPGGHDPAGRRQERRSAAAEASLRHLQLHPAHQRRHRQDLLIHRQGPLQRKVGSFGWLTGALN